MPPSQPLVLALALLFSAGLPAQQSESHSPAIEPYRLAEGEKPKIDGLFDERLWRRAPAIGEFTQVEPVEGNLPTHETEVRVCYDSQYLYMSIRCDDDPAEVRGRLQARDANLDPDDRVEWWIDTFHDQRFAYWFQIGAGGSRGDALISGNGDRFNKSWDGIWYGRSRRTPQGWQAEVALPFKTLAFKENGKTWGFNVRRIRKASRETMRWAWPTVAYRFFRVSRGGMLRGLKGMKQGIGLDVVPYVKGSARRDRRLRKHWTRTGDFGLDVGYRLSPELRVVLTYNTDFAETEVDSRRVNLERFALFFPEKRDFFLADAGLFEFGLPSGGGSGGTVPVPFFSRRIGLDDDGNATPLLFGSKLVGRVKDFNIGVLGVVTDEGVDAEKALGVARLSYNVGPESSIGMIATGGRPTGEGDASTFGADFKFGDGEFFGHGESLYVYGFLLGTANAGPGGDGLSAGARAEYRNREWSHRVTLQSTEEDFDPLLGFVRRRGQRQYLLQSSYTHRGSGFLREIGARFSPIIRTFENSTTESWVIPLTWLDLEFASDDEISVQSMRRFERIPEAFTLRDLATVRRGEYTTTRHVVRAETSSKRVLALEGRLEFGDLYDGDLFQWEVEATLRPSPSLEIAGEFEEFRVDLPTGSFTTQVTEGRFDYHFSPEASLRNLVQYDTASKELTLQSRMRWILEPGRDLFLLAVLGWEKADHESPFVPTTQDATIKLVYTQRF